MKIGIITHYYNSENYGGNLQAYALCRVLNKMGHNAEQISLDRTIDKGIWNEIKKPLRKVKHFRGITAERNFKVRKKSILGFNKSIAHSPVYSEKNICSAGDKYDAYITGSDQVWHPHACCDAYLLKFVPSHKLKLSYAASIAHNEIPEKFIAWYKEGLKDFRGISVREYEAIGLLKDIAPIDVEQCLDPTLLLLKEEWEEIASPSDINEPYLFCYYLGESKRDRTLAKEYATKKGLKIVTLPNLQGVVRSCDENFGDYMLYDVSPQKLISLISAASCVFTDSFHACVFSIIFKKDFFVFHRSEYRNMNSRIVNLLDMFNLNENFCDTDGKANLDYIERISSVNSRIKQEKYLAAREASFEYLEKNLVDEN